MSQTFDFTNVKDEDRKDIVELSTRIKAFQTGQEDEERFKHYRLTRGVYGQRQLGVQMFRTKIPFGKITADQNYWLSQIFLKNTLRVIYILRRVKIFKCTMLSCKILRQYGPHWLKVG